LQSEIKKLEVEKKKKTPAPAPIPAPAAVSVNVPTEGGKEGDSKLAAAKAMAVDLSKSLVCALSPLSYHVDDVHLTPFLL
jgi:hypothetical protein